jgi:hypothetical protein
MSETLTKIVVDCSTGEQTILPLTAEEIAQREIDASAAAEAKAVADAEAQAAADAKASAITKLSKLGLSDAEIAALVGA